MIHSNEEYDAITPRTIDTWYTNSCHFNFLFALSACTTLNE